MHIEKREATRWIKCVCCGEMIHTCEKYLQVVNDSGKDVRGERYCLDCEEYAYENNPELRENARDEDDGERHLRMMEHYADYSAAGCREAFWDDLNGGYLD